MPGMLHHKEREERSFEKEYSYIIWKCFFFMGGTEWRDYFNTGAWNHHCDVYIRPVGTTTYLLWRIYTSRGTQRVKNTFFTEHLLVTASGRAALPLNLIPSFMIDAEATVELTFFVSKRHCLFIYYLHLPALCRHDI